MYNVEGKICRFHRHPGNLAISHTPVMVETPNSSSVRRVVGQALLVSRVSCTNPYIIKTGCP